MTSESVAINKWNPLFQLKRLYDWTLKWAEHPLNTTVLTTFAIAESFIFPIPVDPLMMAMGIAKPKRAFYYALLTTIGSVCGAILGYWIGAAFWAVTKDFFLGYVFSEKVFNLVTLKFQENEVIAILLASFTPLPFKVFTITAGVAGLSLPTFVLSALVGRASRFFLVNGLIYFFGESIKSFIDKYFNALAILFGFLGLLGYYLLPKVLA